jgi:hypothetical protein
VRIPEDTAMNDQLDTDDQPDDPRALAAQIRGDDPCPDVEDDLDSGDPRALARPVRRSASRGYRR